MFNLIRISFINILFLFFYQEKKKFLSFNAIPHQENPIYKSNADSFFKKASNPIKFELLVSQ